ncbi:type III secretion system export apparatus subunit SctT [Parasphingorhabdus cellanae]|uniref:Type III secretion system export apparatus subunit SctT n=2 Tax=Parasphingorhabdus cellanae TaxID=2806553 RepID=A0ABX7T812_9SPHN|nr:type III secretion system export apparatus subunit SctT [Parasphingorhabdus cellanae]
MFLPLFSTAVIPAMVRNSLIVTFGLVAFSLQADFIPRDLSAIGWLVVFLKEAGAGTVIGFFFGTILWAMGAAGEMIDNKVGATIAQILNPMTGTQSSLTSDLLTRFGQVVFVTAGGITILVGVVMESYAIWPIGPGGLRFNLDSVTLFQAEFGRMFTLAFLFAAPAIVMLYIIDAGLGLLNRIAPQFNVFILSLPIKSVAATFVLILILPLIAEALLHDLGTRAEVSTEVLRGVGTPTGN